MTKWLQLSHSDINLLIVNSMASQKDSLNESLTLLQWYYSYFLLSLYTDTLMKQGKINKPTGEVILSTWDKSWIKLNTKRITTLLEQIEKSPKSKNVYGYLWYISSIKWLFGICMDMHSRSSSWRTYLKKLLWQRYDSYIHCIRVARNLLTHQHTTDLRMSKYDVASQRIKLSESDKRIISLSFQYKEIFGKIREWSPSYWFHISINTATLHTKRTLFDIIDEHTLFMLAESVFNIAEQYTKSHKK